MFKIPSEGGAGDRVPTTNRTLLELSRLSKLPERKAFRLPDFENSPAQTAITAVCVGCGGKLDHEDSLQKRFSGCRKCISIYGRLEARSLETEKLERQAILEKFIGGAK